MCNLSLNLKLLRQMLFTAFLLLCAGAERSSFIVVLMLSQCCHHYTCGQNKCTIYNNTQSAGKEVHLVRTVMRFSFFDCSAQGKGSKLFFFFFPGKSCSAVTSGRGRGKAINGKCSRSIFNNLGQSS